MRVKSSSRRRRDIAIVGLAGAAILGSLHAAASIYWDFGGAWMLESVGPWAVDAAKASGLATTLALFGIGALKLGVAILPLAAHRSGALERSAFARALVVLTGAALTLYGLMQTAGAGLGAIIALSDGRQPGVALLGHLLLWGPAFLGWGMCLIWALVARSRPESDSGAVSQSSDNSM